MGKGMVGTLVVWGGEGMVEGWWGGFGEEKGVVGRGRDGGGVGKGVGAPHRGESWWLGVDS